MRSALFLLILPLWLTVPSCDRIRSAVMSKSSGTAATAGDGVIHVVTSERHDVFINQQGPLVVVDYYADWCPPCRKLAPILARVAGEFKDVALVGKVDVDAEKELAMRNNIRGIPEVRFFRDGQMVDRFSGAVSESELRRRFTAHSAGATIAAGDAPVVEAPPAGEAGGGEPAAPAIAPMSKDWMPPGIERR
jgi:thioredoxin 1